jgi:hypothetical protein
MKRSLIILDNNENFYYIINIKYSDIDFQRDSMKTPNQLITEAKNKVIEIKDQYLREIFRIS